MGKYIKMKDAVDGKLVVNTKHYAIVLLDGGAFVDNRIFEELKEAGFPIEEDAAAGEEFRKNVREQYAGGPTHEGKEVAEALNDAIVNRGINTTAPPAGDWDDMSADQQSPTVLAAKEEGLTGEYAKDQDEKAEKAKKAEKVREKARHEDDEELHEREALSVGEDPDDFKVGTAERDGDKAGQLAGSASADQSVTDTDKKAHKAAQKA